MMTPRPIAPSNPMTSTRKRRFPRVPRLWMRLWLAYTVLCFFGMSAIMILSGTGFSASNYLSTFSEELLADTLIADSAPYVSLLKSEGPPGDDMTGPLFDRTLERMRFLRDEGSIDRKFDLGDASRPEARLTLFAQDGNVFRTQRTDSFDEGAGGISAEVVIRDGEVALGVLRAELKAPFDLWQSLAGSAIWAASMAPITLLTSAIIGLGCGLVAAGYVTRRLQKIDEVTAEWRLGRFDRTIDLQTGDELETHAKRLNAMAAELESHLNLKNALAVSEERNRIARDLHDTVKQKLFALGLQLATARTKSEPTARSRDHLDEAEMIGREAQEDLVSIISQLRPTGDASASFAAQLAALSETFGRRFPVSITADVPEGFQVDPAHELHIVRIVQEALANAVRHGHPRTIDIRAREEDSKSCLIIADDGCGFDPDATPPGLGLQSIRQRTAVLPSGDLVIDSEPGGGTRLTIRWRRKRDDR